jgi:hypothetical protein
LAGLVRLYFPSHVLPVRGRQTRPLDIGAMHEKSTSPCGGFADRVGCLGKSPQAADGALKMNKATIKGLLIVMGGVGLLGGVLGLLRGNSVVDTIRAGLGANK